MSEQVFSGELFCHLQQQVVRFFTGVEIGRHVSDQDRKVQLQIRRKKCVRVDAELLEEGTCWCLNVSP